jgi:hypothetical protein
MGSLIATNDKLDPPRLNRGFMPSRLFDPVYDVDDAGVITVRPVAIDGDDVVTSTTTHYTVPSSGVAVAILHRVTLCNNDTVTQNAGVYLVPSGGSAGQPSVIFFDTLQPGETVQLEGPWFLDPSDMIQSLSVGATANKVSLRAEACEYAALPAGVSIVVVDGATLTTSRVAYYTYGGTNYANVYAITLCNFDASARSVTVEVRPSGGSQSVNQQIFNGTLTSGESVIIGGFLLEPGDAVYAQASANTAVSIRLSPVHWT